MESWDLGDRDNEMNAILSTWAFKLKLFTYGLINKFKSQFCDRNDQQ